MVFKALRRKLKNVFIIFGIFSYVCEKDLEAKPDLLVQIGH
jgi:hypothetical protein